MTPTDHPRTVPSRFAALVGLLCLLTGCGSSTSLLSTSSAPAGDPGDARGVHQCGIERWAVKTGTDPAARGVRVAPVGSTVAALGRIRPPVPEPTSRVGPTETTTWTVHATVTAIKEESDSDYHLALSAGGQTMIAEAPDPACAMGSMFAAQITKVRAAVNRACPLAGPRYLNVRIPAVLTGVGFFDRIHGQRGVAPNGIELHPLLAVRLEGKC